MLGTHKKAAAFELIKNGKRFPDGYFWQIELVSLRHCTNAAVTGGINEDAPRSLKAKGGGEVMVMVTRPTSFILPTLNFLLTMLRKQTNCALSDERSEKPETVQQHDSE